MAEISRFWLDPSQSTPGWHCQESQTLKTLEILEETLETLEETLEALEETLEALLSINQA